jgi:hypothetical protein
MKTRNEKKKWKWIVSVVLLAGLVYSVTALSPSTKPVYASSCDCVEARQDALEICKAIDPNNYGLLLFQCPTGSAQDHFDFLCRPDQQYLSVNCSF